jgi:polyisoprenoid-binding protein YceI
MTISTTTTWTIDPDQSSAEFQVKHLGLFTVHGLVERFTGSLAADGGALQALVLESDGAPHVAFASSAVAGPADRRQVIGTLTIHGVAREVVLDAEVTAPRPDGDGRERLTLVAAVDVHHEDFDVEWEDLIPGGAAVIAGHARLVITLAATRAG